MDITKETGPLHAPDGKPAAGGGGRKLPTAEAAKKTFEKNSANPGESSYSSVKKGDKEFLAKEKLEGEVVMVQVKPESE